MTHIAYGWQLQSYPKGLPTQDNVALTEQQLPELQSGQVLIRNLWLTVDPYMRGRMTPVKSYVPPFELNAWMQGGAVGEVIASNNEKFNVGSKVLHMQGWRDMAISDGSDLNPLPETGAPLQSYLGVLGLTGLTAWLGLNRIGQVKKGDTVFVSGAAGAVGSMVVQLAKLKGARVIGSVGSDDKGLFLKESLGADGYVNYKTSSDLTQSVHELAPEGIDYYFDNVGGEHLQAAIANMKDYGQLVICGMIDLYNNQGSNPGPANMTEIIRRRLSIKGFIAGDHMADFPEFVQEVGSFMANGQIKAEETVFNGLETSFDAFLGLFSGANTGKMLVKL